MIATIKKYFDKIEQINSLTFETDTSLNSNGARVYTQFCYLTEAQSNFVMSLSKNTEKVVNFKLKLIQSFEKAKQIIKSVIPAQNDRIKELELQVQANRLALEVRQLDSAMLTLHGAKRVVLEVA